MAKKPKPESEVQNGTPKDDDRLEVIYRVMDKFHHSDMQEAREQMKREREQQAG